MTMINGKFMGVMPVGDNGQRYSFRVHTHQEGEPPTHMGVILSPTATDADLHRMQKWCDIHPYWHTPFIIDRQDGDKVVKGVKL